MGKSDHAVITFNLNVATTTESDKIAYSYYKGNYENIKQEMLNVDWDSLINDTSVEVAWKTFHNKLIGSIERNIPKQKYKNRKNHHGSTGIPN